MRTGPTRNKAKGGPPPGRSAFGVWVVEGPLDPRDGFDQKNPLRMPPGLVTNGLEHLMHAPGLFLNGSLEQYLRETLSMPIR